MKKTLNPADADTILLESYQKKIKDKVITKSEGFRVVLNPSLFMQGVINMNIAAIIRNNFTAAQKEKIQIISEYITNDEAPVPTELLKRFTAFTERPSILKYESVVRYFSELIADSPLKISSNDLPSLPGDKVQEIQTTLPSLPAQEGFLTRNETIKAEDGGIGRLTRIGEHPCDECRFRQNCDILPRDEEYKRNNCRTFLIFRALQEYETIAEEINSANKRSLSLT